MTTAAERFDQELQRWVEAHAAHTGAAADLASVANLLATRIPAELREQIGRGFLDGHLVTTKGYWAGPPNEPTQAQYMLERRAGACVPCWEVFVLHAESLRLRAALASTGLALQHEDDLMDFTARDGGDLLGYVEMKVDARDAKALVEAVARHGRSGIDFATPDRKNDALKKTKYLLAHRPRYFGVHAIGFDAVFEVVYTGDDHFELREGENARRLDDVLGDYRATQPAAPRNRADEPKAAD